MNIFKALVNASDLEWEFVAVSIVKAHQHSTSAASDQEQAIGKPVAGNTKKIHIAVEEFCLPIKFQITDGEVHDYKIAPEFIATLPTEDFIIAEEHDSEEVREIIRRK